MQIWYNSEEKKKKKPQDLKHEWMFNEWIASAVISKSIENLTMQPWAIEINEPIDGNLCLHCWVYNAW